MDPMLIDKATGHYMGFHQFTKGEDSKNFLFTYSPKGYTSRVLSLEWLKQLFEPRTRPSTAPDGTLPPRLLILDGHDLHVCIEFIPYAEEYNIKLFCLPPHTTHLLQLLDVVLFSPLQRYYGQAVHHYLSCGGTGIRKATFLPLYIETRKKTYRPNLI